MATERLQVLLALEAGQYRREAKRAADATKEIGDGAGKTNSKLGDMRERMNASGKVAAAALGGVAVAAMADAVRAASDLGESINAVEKVFGDASGQIEAFGQVSAQAAGLSRREFNQLATSTGSLLTNFGFSAQEAASQATQLTLRASDMASVFNTDVDQALEAVNAGLRGETEPLRKFGVSLSDAAIRAKAVELGLAETTAAVDANGKATAALELIYEQTAKTQGDFIQTNDSLANSMRRSAAEWENAKASFGESVLPLASSFLDRFSTGVLMIRSNFDDAADSALQFNRGMDAIVRAMQEGTNPALAFQDALFFIAENSDLTTEQLLALASAAGVSIEDTDAFGESLAEMARELGYSEEVIAEVVAAIEGVPGPAQEAADAVEDVGEETDKADRRTRSFAAALQLAATRQREATQAYLEAINPIVNAVSSINRATEAEQALIELQESGTASTKEIAQAKLDWAAAQYEAQAAIDSMDPAQLERALEGIGRAINGSTEDARELLVELGLLDGKTITTIIRTRFEEVRDVADRISPQEGGRTYGGGRAHGGAVDTDHWYMVGEDGPEPFVPHVPGTIIPNTAQSFSTVNGGDMNLTFVSSGDVVQDAQVASIMLSTHKLVGGGLRGGAR